MFLSHAVCVKLSHFVRFFRIYAACIETICMDICIAIAVWNYLHFSKKIFVLFVCTVFLFALLYCVATGRSK